MSRPTCEAIGCRAAILDTEVFCVKHWHMLESDTKRTIAKTFRAGGKRQSAAYMASLAFAQSEILFFQTNGHRMPKDSSFEWAED